MPRLNIYLIFPLEQTEVQSIAMICVLKWFHIASMFDFKL